MFSIKVEPEDSAAAWDEKRSRTVIIPRIKQERIEEDTEESESGVKNEVAGDSSQEIEESGNVVLQVTVHLEDDEVLADRAENKTDVGDKTEDSDQEDEGGDLSPTSHLGGHQIHFSIADPISLAGNSSLDNTYTDSASQCELTADEDPRCQSNSSPVQSKCLTYGEVCEESFYQKQHHEEDEVAHTGKKLFKCQFCEKSFIHSHKCKGHKRTHKDEKHFQCQFCGKTFKQKFTCKAHEMTHSGERPFQCQFCRKAFILKAACKKHEMIHTGEKPFKCQFCEKSFRQKYVCKRHEMIHTGEKSFKCQFCEKSFIEKNGWRRHERTHVGWRPFKCQFCEKSFNKKYYHEVHEMTHVGFKIPLLVLVL